MFNLYRSESHWTELKSNLNELIFVKLNLTVLKASGAASSYIREFEQRRQQKAWTINCYLPTILF